MINAYIFRNGYVRVLKLDKCFARGRSDDEFLSKDSLKENNSSISYVRDTSLGETET